MMKKTLMIFLLLHICLLAAFAHEEPSKTLKEKQKKEEKRLQVLKNKIKSVITWKHSIHEGIKTEEKEKFIETIYDKSGNTASIMVYKHPDSLDYKIIFNYDDDNNLITDTDYNPDGSLYEKIDYTIDEFGRVKSQLNYTAAGDTDSKFCYNINYEKNTLLFKKYKPLDKIEYEMIYKYDGNPDKSNNTEIIKQSPNGKLIMRVENTFDNKGTRTQKKIFDTEDKLMYYFEYTYNDQYDDINSITKKTADHEIISKTQYTYDTKGLLKSVNSYDNNMILISCVSYSYQLIE